MQNTDYPFATTRTRGFCRALVWNGVAILGFCVQVQNFASAQQNPSPQKDDISRFIVPKENSPAVTEAEVRQRIRMLSDSNYNQREAASAFLRENQSIAIPLALSELQNKSGESLDRMLSFLGEVISDPTSPMSFTVFEELKKLSKRTDGSRSAQIFQAYNSIRQEYGQRTWERIKALCPETRTEIMSRSTRIQVRNLLDISPRFQGTAADLQGLDQVDWVQFARLEGPAINRDILKATLQLPQLKHLQIVNASMSVADLEILKDGPDLDVLELTYVPVDDEFVSLVQQLPVWGSLWIFGSKISPAGAEELARNLSDVNVDVFRGAYLGVISLANSLVVQSVEPGSAAEAASIKPDDRIVSVNDIKLESFDHLRRELGKFTPGEEVTIEVGRMIRIYEPPPADKDRDGQGQGILPNDLDALIPRVKSTRSLRKLKVVLGTRPG